MVFSSNIFLYIFLPFCLFFYYLSPRIIKNITLLIFSIFFYIWGETSQFYIIILSIILNYFFAILIGKEVSTRKRKNLLFLILFFNIGALFYFKCFNIFDDYILGDQYKILKLPLGISFFTFHAISYVVDIYRQKAQPQKSIINLGLYIINFAQLVAGPIIRYSDINNQLENRKITKEDFIYGIRRFILGFSKKVLIANNLATVADSIFLLKENNLYTSAAWLGIIAYSLQIYFDFSGYSDMAIGLGRIFGFNFKENFNSPYASRSIQEFWQKWHISLSSWFKDYLYIPLGGNRKGNLRTYLNLITVFVLCGLWHGTNPTFLVWGLWHGIFLILERFPFFSKITKMRILNRIYTLIIIIIGWVLFRVDSLDHAIYFLQNMFTLQIPQQDLLPFLLNNEIIIALVVGIVLSILSKEILENILSKNIILSKPIQVLELMVLFITFFISIISLAGNTYNPFIYYKF